jgi:hypothetical protein
MSKQRDLAGVARDAGTGYVNVAGDTMTGELITPRATITDVFYPSSGYSAWKQTNYFGDLYLNNGPDRFKIDSAGRVTMPYQPFARVRPVNGNQGSYTNAGNITCVWTDVVENVGGHYNSVNGRFTCPVAGLYEVAFNSNWYFGGSPGAYILPRIMKNGGEVYRYYQSVFGITWHQIQGVAQLTCSAGDYFTLENITASGTGGGADVGLYTHLTFRLIG